MRARRTDDGQCLIESDDGKQSIKLSEPEFLALGQLALELKDHIESQQGGKYRPIAQIPIANVILSLDAHHTQVLVRFVEPSGFENAYALDPDLAQRMRDGLIEKLEEVDAAKRGRTTN
jgi:hypothetical protein